MVMLSVAMRTGSLSPLMKNVVTSLPVFILYSVQAWPLIVAEPTFSQTGSAPAWAAAAGASGMAFSMTILLACISE